MAEKVFVFGAGASKQGGAPVMANFIQEAERVLDDGYRLKLDNVIRFIDDCKYLHSHSNLDLENLEVLYGVAEMAKVTRYFPEYTIEQIEEVCDALRQVIAATLERTLTFPSYDGRVSPPSGYAELIDNLPDNEKDPRKVAFLTFNYDLGLDYALNFYGIKNSYCVEQPTRDSIRLLKLHGSLNWFYCEGCNQVVTWPLNDFFRTRNWQHYGRASETKRLTVAEHLNAAPHNCSASTKPRQPLIVPPTWNKPNYQQALGNVWASAAEVLTDVRDLIIIGFSLPETDLFFKYLYSVGTASARLRTVRVFDPSTHVKERFENLLGIGARSKFQFQPVTFGDAVKEIWGGNPRAIFI